MIEFFIWNSEIILEIFFFKVILLIALILIYTFLYAKDTKMTSMWNNCFFLLEYIVIKVIYFKVNDKQMSMNPSMTMMMTMPTTSRNATVFSWSYWVLYGSIGTSLIASLLFCVNPLPSHPCSRQRRRRQRNDSMKNERILNDIWTHIQTFLILNSGL